MGLTAPPAETTWLLHHVLGFDGLPEGDTLAVLEQATRFGEARLAPLDRDGDRIGARFADGAVTPPPGFAEAFRSFAEDGWMGIAASPEHGGQGLPHAVALAAFEPFSSSNMAFALCPMLTQDAITLLEAHADADQKARLLTPMVAGRWSGTMCLTEPQSGSDLSGVRTRAVPVGGWPPDYWAEDLHHLGRARDEREHRASGARAAAGCAGRQRRDLAVRGAARVARRQPQCAAVPVDRAQAGHPWQPDLRDGVRGGDGRADRGAASRAVRDVSR